MILFHLFATGVINTVGIFAAGVIDTGGNLPPGSLTLAANLPAVLLTLVANLPPVSTTLAKLVAKLFMIFMIDTLIQYVGILVSNIYFYFLF
jgi:hypothetical protein